MVSKSMRRVLALAVLLLALPGVARAAGQAVASCCGLCPPGCC